MYEWSQKCKNPCTYLLIAFVKKEDPFRNVLNVTLDMAFVSIAHIGNLGVLHERNI